jgi:hypothetical protein
MHEMSKRMKIYDLDGNSVIKADAKNESMCHVHHFLSVFEDVLWIFFKKFFCTFAFFELPSLAK